MGKRVRDLSFPGDGVLVAIVRDGRSRAPEQDAAVEVGDELLFTISEEHERELSHYLVPVTKG